MSRPTVINVIAWGKKFTHLAADNVLACLLVSGQLDDPDLRAAGEVIIHLTMPRDDVDALERTGVLARLRMVARLEHRALSPAALMRAQASNSRSRALIAWAEYDSLACARRLGADWIPLNADTLISNRFVPAVKKRLLGGWLAVAGAPFRTEREGFQQEAGARRDFSATELYALSLRHMHSVTLNYFLRKMPAALPVAPHQVLFTSQEGFVAHSIQLCPYGVDTRALPDRYTPDGMTVDVRLLSDVLRGRDFGTTCWIDRAAPGDAYLTSLDDAAGITAFGRLETSIAQVARSARHFMRYRRDLDYFRWTAAQRVVYPVPPTQRARLPSDCVDEESAIAAIIGRMRMGLRRSIELWFERAPAPLDARFSAPEVDASPEP
jgi:hypothetical protein